MSFSCFRAKTTKNDERWENVSPQDCSIRIISPAGLLIGRTTRSNLTVPARAAGTSFLVSAVKGKQKMRKIIGSLLIVAALAAVAATAWAGNPWLDHFGR
jgi:hypothetical protein